MIQKRPGANRRSFYLYTVFPSRHHLAFPPDPPPSSGVTTLSRPSPITHQSRVGGVPSNFGRKPSIWPPAYGLCEHVVRLCTVRPNVRSGSELLIKSHREYSRQFLKLLCIFTAPSPFKTAQEHRTGQEGLPLGMTTAPGDQEASRKKQLRSH